MRQEKVWNNLCLLLFHVLIYFLVYFFGISRRGKFNPHFPASLLSFFVLPVSFLHLLLYSFFSFFFPPFRFMHTCFTDAILLWCLSSIRIHYPDGILSSPLDYWIAKATAVTETMLSAGVGKWKRRQIGRVKGRSIFVR